MNDDRARILIVDDQPDNRLVLEHLLGGRYAVRCAGSGREALELMAGPDLPDLLLLDVMMPEPDGFEVCRRLKERPESRDVPIIFLTGLDGAGDEERGLALGADDFIRKPFVPLVVLARVRNLLGRREAMRRQAEIAVVEARLAEQQKAAGALRAMVDRLTAMNTELERFAVIAAHDLREPLRAVVSYSQLLERQCGDRLYPEEHESLAFIVGGARRIYDRISGLLAYSHVAANRGVSRMVDSAAACGLALEALASIVGDSGATITIAPDLPVVEADEPQLVQLFQNLIGNAVKFRRPGHPPRVTVTAGRAVDGGGGGGGVWRFSVADDGIGFDPGQQDVFELFRQLHGADEYGGTGVGLAICKRIVQGLGGRIWAESAPGRGSTFHFTIPDHAPDHVSDDAAETRPGAPSP